MNIKKDDWLNVIEVLFLLVFVVMLLVVPNSSVMKLATAEQIQLVERSDQKVWRGIVKDNPVHRFGSYIEFDVENPSDNQDYKFRLSVINKPNFNWEQTDSREFNIGDEILFFPVIATAEFGKGKAFFCPIGIFYPGKYKGGSFINGYEVANPPKKK